MDDEATSLDVGAMRAFVREQLIRGAATFVQERSSWRASGEARWDHTRRVVKFAQEIARAEGADYGIVTVAGIFHDVAKLDSEQEAHAVRGAEIAREYLVREGFPADWIERVCQVIVHHPAKHVVPTEQMTLEVAVLRDADLLDETGALGILWTAMNAGGLNATSYADARKRIVKHDLDGCKRVIELMLTRTGRAIAEQRLAFVEAFIQQLDAEMVL